jgi:hypothetical protein
MIYKFTDMYIKTIKEKSASEKNDDENDDE